MAAIRVTRRPWAVIAHAMLVSLAVSASDSISAPAPETLLPYIPTAILVPAAGSSAADAATAYILTPGSTDSDTGRSVDLVALNISSSLASSSLSRATTTLTSGLPFLSSSSSNTTAFSPTLAYDGSIIAHIGDCASATASSAVWVYNTSSSSSTWTQLQNASSAATSPQFLGGSVAFSEVIAPSASAPQIYTYGGQCPDAALNGTTWVNGADYSNAMVRVQLLSSSSLGDDIDGEYRAETLSLANAPVAEAGFSWTSLRPSTSNISGTVTQGVNSVVLGGHTRNAFVNMSTAAVWTLPEESWSYVTISGPAASTSASAKVDVQSRSGHTAVLNEAGTALIILGGWVGNTSLAATPQLVILDMSESSFGEWMWVIPEEQPLSDGQGIYGHGAALLPGNVMMVAGGYSTSSSLSSSKVRARDGDSNTISAAGGALPMFFNLTSLSWSNNYINPTSTSSSSTSSSTSSNNATKLGLEIGLGAGIPILLLLLCLAFICICRHHRRHAHRDAHIRGLTAGGAFITSEEMLASVHDLHDPLHQQEQQQYPWVPKVAARWYSYTGGHDPYLRGEKSPAIGHEDMRGEGLGLPQPTDYAYDYYNNNENNSSSNNSSYKYYNNYNASGAYRGAIGRRKPNPRVAQGLYQPAGLDESRAMAGITPIMEDEEDEEEMAMHGAMSPDKDMEGADDDEHEPFIVPGAHMPPPHSPTAAEVGAGVLSQNTAPPNTNRMPTPTPLLSGPQTSYMQPSLSAPVLPQPQHPEVTDWVTDVDVSDALITHRLQHPHRVSSSNSGSAARMLGGAVGSGGRLSPIRGGALARSSSVRFSDGELTPTPTTPGGRTESNLSDSNRSTFSFVPNRSDSTRRPGFLSVGGSGGGGDPSSYYGSNKRGGTSHSDHSSSGTSSGGASFTTAKSISALRSEGPGLLQLGRPRPVSGIEDMADISDGDEPGSPSKSKAPPRRSWFGSLRKVFSGQSSSDSSLGSRYGSGANSMRTESPTQGDSNDYDRFGLGSLGLGGVGGMLQKRRQGRWAWEGDVGASASAQQQRQQEQTDGRQPSGADEGWEGGEGDEEWDIERAVEQRLVQVMFSVPKERLRIVNGEPDLASIEESVVVVDLDEVEGDVEGQGRDKGKDRADEPVVAGSAAHYVDEPHDANDDEDEDDDDDGDDGYISTPNTADELGISTNDDAAASKVTQQEQQHRRLEAENTAPVLFLSSKASFESASNEKTQQDEQKAQEQKQQQQQQHQHQYQQQERQRLRDIPHFQHLHHLQHLQPPPRTASLASSSVSIKTADYSAREDSPTRQGSVSPGVPMQAEAVRLERRQTRVLDLVETFEQRSRSTSPVKDADRWSR
ncbi:hypothetical protein BD289DRAFT_484169 [Coniella lustricola]|uniref:Galactose oxidase n=1 Tax=Coniella lustricola TaxID=2025994 RepID=A0A2T3A2W0_9PEZI|nr:hypothetical protein BD289DRAFT_484169 [Coniella lustricola]